MKKNGHKKLFFFFKNWQKLKIIGKISVVRIVTFYWLWREPRRNKLDLSINESTFNVLEKIDFVNFKREKFQWVVLIVSETFHGLVFGGSYYISFGNLLLLITRKKWHERESHSFSSSFISAAVYCVCENRYLFERSKKMQKDGVDRGEIRCARQHKRARHCGCGYSVLKSPRE